MLNFKKNYGAIYIYLAHHMCVGSGIHIEMIYTIELY